MRCFMNIYNKKSRRIFTAVLAIILVLSMVVPFLVHLM